MLPTDWGSPTSWVLARIDDPRATQYWDAGHLVSHALEPELPAGEPPCCRRGGALWDDAAVFAPGTRFGAAAPAWMDGPVVHAAATLPQHLAALAPR